MPDASRGSLVLRERPTHLALAAATAIVVALTLALAGAAAPPPAAATTPTVQRFGVNDLRGWWMGSPNLPAGYPVQAHRNLATRDLNDMAAHQLIYRCAFNVSELDTNSDGVIDSWAFPDALFKTAAQRGVKVLVVLTGNAAPNTTGKRANFALDAKAILGRYRAGGSYWAANPTLVQKPIDTFELWNEPNQSVYWGATPEDYGKLLGQVYKRTNEVVTGFKLVSGGLAETSSNGQRPAAWLASALAVADDELTSIYPNPFFALQGAGLHTYGAPSATVNQAITNLRKFNSELRAAVPDIYPQPPTWITEFGWRYTPVTNTTGNTYSESEILTRYSSFVTQALNFGSAVGPLFAYNYRMGGTGTNLDDGFGWNSTTGKLYGDDTTQAQLGTQRSYGTWFEALATTGVPPVVPTTPPATTPTTPASTP
jgi:hypothetical protein